MARVNQAAATNAALEESDHGRPVDLVHLAKYTMGNRELEHEVLTLFTKQSLIYLDRLRDAADQQTWREAAHTLKGSARGIGAWQVADVVASLELHAADKAQKEKQRLVENLREVVGEANDFIDQLLADQ